MPPTAVLPSLAGLVAVAALIVASAHYRWLHDRHAIDGLHVFVSQGWLAPRMAIATRRKLQSVEIVQGLVARRRGYATVAFGLAGGQLEIGGIPLDGARAIRAAVLDSMSSVDFSQI